MCNSDLAHIWQGGSKPDIVESENLATPQNKVTRIKIMAFAAARMIKEKKNLEAEHKKRSSDGLSKTKSKVMSPQT